MNDVLGEEADIAECEICTTTLDRDKGIECEGCGGFFCFQCYHTGARPHLCGILTDRNGKKVEVGTVLQYKDTDRVYTVNQITSSFSHSGLCYGERRGSKTEHKVIIRPRLMVIC